MLDIGSDNTDIRSDIGYDIVLPAWFDGSFCRQRSPLTADSEGQGHKEQGRFLQIFSCHYQPVEQHWVGAHFRRRLVPKGLLEVSASTGGHPRAGGHGIAEWCGTPPHYLCSASVQSS